MIRLLLILMMCLPASAGTFYVATNGSDSADGSIGTPWATLYYASRKMTNGGDTVYIRAGKYSGNTHSLDLGTTKASSGTPASPNTMQPYTGETVIIADTTYPYKCIMLNAKSNWIFNGLIFSNNYAAVDLISCTNVVFTNCTFQGPLNTNNYDHPLVRFEGASKYNKILDCNFHDWGAILAVSGDEKGTMIALGNETTDDETWYNLIQGCHFWRGGHDISEPTAAYNVWRSNTFHQEPWILTNSALAPGWTNMDCDSGLCISNVFNYYGNRVFKICDSGTYQIDMRGVFEDNTIEYTGVPTGDQGGYGFEIAGLWSIYRRNVIRFCLVAGIHLNRASATTFTRSNSIYANTIYSCGHAARYAGTGSLTNWSAGIGENDYNAATYGTSNLILNNIVWDCNKTNVSTIVRQYNLYGTNWTGDEAASYPLFVNTNGFVEARLFGTTEETIGALPDLSLQAASPCIDAGGWLAKVTSDSGTGTAMNLDNSLPFSDGNKIVTGDTIQLQGQSTTAVVTSNNWTTMTLTFSPALTWTNGQGVSLAYSGAAPDMGAFEYTSEESPGGSASRATVGTLIIRGQ